MWIYKSATFHGTKSNPRLGDFVVINIEDNSDSDGVLTKQFKFRYVANGYDSFKTLVRRETKAHLAGLNKSSSNNDATNDFRPT